MAYDEEDWSDRFLGVGALHDLRDDKERKPPLYHAKSVSRSAAEAMAPRQKPKGRRPAGFGRWK